MSWPYLYQELKSTREKKFVTIAGPISPYATELMAAKWDVTLRKQKACLALSVLL